MGLTFPPGDSQQGRVRCVWHQTRGRGGRAGVRGELVAGCSVPLEPEISEGLSGDCRWGRG